MDTRKLRNPRNTTVIQLDGQVGVLNNPILATAKHMSRTSSRHHARELAAELVKRWNAYPELVRALERARDHMVMSEGAFICNGTVRYSDDHKEAIEQVRAILRKINPS